MLYDSYVQGCLLGAASYTSEVSHWPFSTHRMLKMEPNFFTISLALSLSLSLSLSQKMNTFASSHWVS